MKIVLGFIAAVLVPAGLMVAWYLYGQFTTFAANDPYIWIRTRGFLFICLGVSGVFVVILGIPAYALLRWLNILRWWSTVGTGFLLGFAPMAVWSWPLRYSEIHSSAIIDGVQTLVDGVPTMAGWLQYLLGASFVGACGATGALAFWLVSQVRPNQAFKPTSGKKPPAAA